jgi:hypothetical protein
VPVTSFCEWSGEKGSKREHWFSVPAAPIFSFAGIWRPTEEGNCYSFLTCDPNPLVEPIHPKAMPAIVHEEDYDPMAGWGGGERLCASSPPVSVDAHWPLKGRSLIEPRRRLNRRLLASMPKSAGGVHFCPSFCFSLSLYPRNLRGLFWWLTPANDPAFPLEETSSGSHESGRAGIPVQHRLVFSEFWTFHIVATPWLGRATMTPRIR